MKRLVALTTAIAATAGPFAALAGTQLSFVAPVSAQDKPPDEWIADLHLEASWQPTARADVKEVRKLRLVVTNEGPDPAAGVGVAAGRGTGLDPKWARTTQGECEIVREINRVRCQLGTMQPGDDAVVRIATRVRVRCALRDRDDASKGWKAVPWRLKERPRVASDESEREPDPADNVRKAVLRVSNRLPSGERADSLCNDGGSPPPTGGR